MEKKLIIWFIGGNSVGKTTMATVFHDWFSRYCPGLQKPEIVTWQEEGKKCCYTNMNGISANLGEFGLTACGGTDTLNSKYQIQRSFEEAIKQRQVVIIEGIMATNQWQAFLRRKDAVLWTILLDVGEKANFSRLRKRRAAKRGIAPEQVEINAKTRENMSGKLRGFRSLYRKASEYSDHATRLNTSKFSIPEVSKLLRAGLRSVIVSQF